MGKWGRLPRRLSPESTGLLFNLAGLLTCFRCCAFPTNSVSGSVHTSFKKLTATGIVPDFHRIPFLISFYCRKEREPNLRKGICFYCLIINFNTKVINNMRYPLLYEAVKKTGASYIVRLSFYFGTTCKVALEGINDRTFNISSIRSIRSGLNNREKRQNTLKSSPQSE